VKGQAADLKKRMTDKTTSCTGNRDHLPLQAIAAMSENRVIGRANSIPWHLPEDFRWFKKKTMGGILIMGRKTFESIGRPLPGRTTWVLTTDPSSLPDTVEAFSSWESVLDRIRRDKPGQRPFICGGEQIYRLALPWCADLFLTVVHRTIPDGDAFLPEFNEFMEFAEIIDESCDFRIVHYRNRQYSS
jgi:dihydrofolate reductase